MNNIISYTMKKGPVLMLGKGLAALISLVPILMLGALESKSTVGIYNYVLAIASIATLFTLPGMNNSLVRSVAQGRGGEITAVIRARIRWGFLGTCSLLIISLYYFIIDSQILALILLIVSLTIPFFNTFAPTVQSFWHGKKYFGTQAFYSVVNKAGIALIVGIIIALTDNPVLLVSSFFIAAWIIGKALYSSIATPVPEPIHAETFSLGKHLTVMIAATKVANNIDKIIIWKLLGPISLATYALAQLPITKITETIPFQPLILPIASTGDLNSVTKTSTLRYIGFLLFLSVPTALILSLSAPFFYTLVLPQYAQSIPLFQSLTVLVALSPLLIVDSLLIGTFQKKKLYLSQILPPLLKIVLLLILIPVYGIWGAVSALIISEIIRGGIALALLYVL